MRQAVIELNKLGPLPHSDKVVRENLRQLVDKYAQLFASIRKPVTDEEARVLLTIFGPDDCFGLVWPLVSLVESAPGWPLVDSLSSTENEWIAMLRQRVENAKNRSTRK
jgi:hypothetical protein